MNGRTDHRTAGRRRAGRHVAALVVATGILMVAAPAGCDFEEDARPSPPWTCPWSAPPANLDREDLVGVYVNVVNPELTLTLADVPFIDNREPPNWHHLDLDPNRGVAVGGTREAPVLFSTYPSDLDTCDDFRHRFRKR